MAVFLFSIKIDKTQAINSNNVPMSINRLDLLKKNADYTNLVISYDNNWIIEFDDLENLKQLNLENKELNTKEFINWAKKIYHKIRDPFYNENEVHDWQRAMRNKSDFK